MSDTPPTGQPNAQEADGHLIRDLQIVNKKGLHARASAKFVQCVERFESQVTVTRANETVGGNSIMGLMMLAAAPGTTIRVTAKGKDAAQAMDAIAELVSGRFGEDE